LYKHVNSKAVTSQTGSAIFQMLCRRQAG